MDEARRNPSDFAALLAEAESLLSEGEQFVSLSDISLVIDGGLRDGEIITLTGDQAIALTVRFHSLRDCDVILRHRTATGAWETFFVRTDGDGYATITVYTLGALLASVLSENENGR